MQHAGNFDLKLEKVIQKPVHEVFQALSEGRLFMNCGAHSDSMQLDFKVGGKYVIEFKNYALTNTGEFLEIVPDKKVVFTWCSSFDLPLKPDTTVTIELFADGAGTRLKLVHAGFKNDKDCAAHEEGWTAGIVDMGQELKEGRLRMVRVFAAPLAQMFETAQKRMVQGKVLESLPGKKIIFDWDSTRVSLSFDSEDEGGSSVEIVQDGLTSAPLRKKHRLGWERITEEMVKTLGRST